MTRKMNCGFLLLLVLHGLIASGLLSAQEPPDGLSPAERGYWRLLHKPYLVREFPESTLKEIWKVWPKELRNRAEQASEAERRVMIYEYYGFTPRPGAEADKPLQYVVNERGDWFMNCFACHGGEVAGQVIPGLPNNRFAMQTLAEDMRAIKPVLGQPYSAKDLAGMLFPMGSSIGTTNAVMFGVTLENYRDKDMNVVSFRPPPTLTHHDMDAPPWWNYRKKTHLYIDGFVARDHRSLIPFTLIKPNDGPRIRGWEDDFREISAYLESLTAPKYPFPIDKTLAAAGHRVFENHCARCHGTYGTEESYDPPTVPIGELGTDPVRLQALTVEHRRNYGESWLGHYGQIDIVPDPGGYVAPPLDGIWASAPYLHNGSVPTLWHLLHPSARPEIWTRTSRDYNTEQVGLQFETLPEIPAGLSPSERRQYFNTRQFGKSAAGHHYPDLLTPEEKHSLLEYLKTL